MKDKVLVLGSSGLLGPYLMDAARDLGTVMGTARHAADVILDITDRDAVRRVVSEWQPNVVIHAAGLTDVEGCQMDPAKAFDVNANSVAHLYKALNPDVQLVYLSTDQVYPNTPGPHREGDEDPVNVYGSSKLAGEREALRHPRGLVLRINIFGPSRTPGRISLSDFVVQSFITGRKITLFTDIYFSPLHMTTLSSLLAVMVKRELIGTYNIGSREGMSKCDFALTVARLKGLDFSSAVPGKSLDIPGRAPRPMDMRMDVTRIEQSLGITMPTLIEELKKL